MSSEPGAGHLPGTGAEKKFWPLSVLAVYLAGRWVGSRASGRGIIATVLLVVLTVGIGGLVDYLMVTDEFFESVLDVKRQLATLLPIMAFKAAVLMVPALLGYWRGRKLRLSKYLYYLLWPAPGLDDTQLGESRLPLELHRAQISDRRVPSL